MPSRARGVGAEWTEWTGGGRSGGNPVSEITGWVGAELSVSMNARRAQNSIRLKPYTGECGWCALDVCSRCMTYKHIYMNVCLDIASAPQTYVRDVLAERVEYVLGVL